MDSVPGGRSAVHRVRLTRTRGFFFSLSCVVLMVSGLLVSCGEELASSPKREGADQGPQYVGAMACRECHGEIWDTYQGVSMASSFAPMTGDNVIEDWTKDTTYYHAASDRYYVMERRGGRFYQRRYQLDSDGNRVRELEREVTHVMGSGRHVRTYVHLTKQGKALQLPVSWYAESQSWAMSPGYDREDQPDFSRPVDYECMVCHNDYPTVAAGKDRENGHHYLGALPAGISCERCHGPGSEHVALAKDDATKLDAVKQAIVNPARLSPSRAMDVCLQCHFESTVNPTIPHRVRGFDRAVFSYRPGEALEDYAVPMDRSPAPRGDDAPFEIAHHGYRLMQSRCFLESNGKMSCVTCHDPHHAPASPAKETWFSRSCQKCHEPEACQVEAMELQRSGVVAADCKSCHMPKRRPHDVVHAVMTDHKIVRRPPPGDLTARMKERIDPYRGALGFALSERARTGVDANALLGVAYVIQGLDPDRGIKLLEASLKEKPSSSSRPYHALGYGKALRGDGAGAVSAFSDAVSKDPQNPVNLASLGLALKAVGRLNEAVTVFERALELDPLDARVLVDLAGIAAQTGHLEEALLRLDRAIAVDAESTVALLRKAEVLSRLGRTQDALDAWTSAQVLDPRSVDALTAIGQHHQAQGDFARAVESFRTARRWHPDHTLSLQLLAGLLATVPDGAIRDPNESLRLLLLLEAKIGAATTVTFDIRAAAHMAMGQVAEAVAAAEQALAMAKREGNGAMADEIAARLSGYRRGEAFFLK